MSAHFDDNIELLPVKDFTEKSYLLLAKKRAADRRKWLENKGDLAEV